MENNHCWYINQKKLIITLPKYFRNKVWAESLGDLYYFDQGQLNSFDNIELDFRECYWIDPIPLISLLILLKDFHLAKSKIISVSLPKANINKDKDRVLKFLYEEGFLSELESVSSEIKYFSRQNKFTLKNITTELNYFGCHLCNAKIIDTVDVCSNDDCFYDFINNLIIEVGVNLRNKKIPENAYDDILYRLYILFAETIFNVYKHAYPNSTSFRYVGIYVRYRHGLQNTSINDNYKSLLFDLLKNELKSTSKTLTEFFQLLCDKDGCIEVFIIDNGVGISETLGLRNNNFTHPARIAFVDIYETEQRKLISTDKNETKIGGLALLGKLIAKEHDFILGKDKDEWLGSSLPDIKKSAYYDLISTTNNNKHTPGCIWQMSLSWKSQKNEPPFWNKTPSNLKNKFLSIYNTRAINESLWDDYIVIDERLVQHSNYFSRQDFFFNQLNNSTKNNIIYLPQNKSTKHLIGFTILQYLSNCLTKEKNLIIADIPDEERVTYIAALNESSYSKDLLLSISKINNICLISQSLSVCCLCFNGHHFVVNPDYQISFFNNDSNLCFSNILTSLISHDSLTIWSSIKKRKKFSTYINSDIFWDELDNKYIDGYLDFNQLCELPEFQYLFFVNIYRVFGLLDINISKINGLDLLVQNIVEKLNQMFFTSNENANNSFTFYIGSIFVKGIIQKEGVLLMKLDHIIFHCFQHPSSASNEVFSLFKWASKKWINKYFPISSINYERLGRTHTITPGGWKYFKIPRYDNYDKSFYYRNPKESYKDWQSLYLGLTIGNFSYTYHNDLIKLNFHAAIEQAFFEKNTLADFLVLNFFYALGGGKIIKSHITNNQKYSKIKDTHLIRKTLLNDTILRDNLLIDIDYWKRILNCGSEMKFHDNIACIVYPNHFHTNLIISKIFAIFKNILTDKIIPLNSIRNDNSKTSVLFSPLNFDVIKSYISQKNNKVLLFDDAVVTGRTRKEIKHLMFYLNAKEVKTLSIIDRQRLPYEIPNPNTQRYYWRLDIPRLGNKFYNPINHSLKIASDCYFRFIESGQNRINQWKSAWNEIASYQSKPSQGLSPVSVALMNPYKKFCIKEDINNHGEYIQVSAKDKSDKSKHVRITTSIGLLTYCIELQTLTGRDDLVLTYLNEDIPKSAKIELICSQLLLLGNETRLSLKIELLEKLLDATNNINLDNHSALAAITILNQPVNIINEIWKSFKYNENNNLDILLAFAISSINSNNFNNRILRRLIKDNAFNKKFELRKSLNYELFEKRNAHISPINAFIDQRHFHLKTMSISLLYSLEKLVEVIKELEYYAFKHENNINKEEVFACLDKAIKLTKSIILNQNLRFDSSVQDEINESEILKIHLNILKDNLFPYLKSIHDNLLFQLTGINSNDSSFTLKIFIDEICQDISLNNKWEKIIEEKRGKVLSSFFSKENPIIQITEKGLKTISELSSPTLLACWIPMDKIIKKHIKYLISNLVHGSCSCIKDPYDINSTLAHMWYSFEFNKQDMMFIIEFVNPVNDINYSLVNAEKSSRPEKEHCAELLCETSYLKKPEFPNLLFTHIRMKLI